MHPTIGPGCDAAPGRAKTIMVTSPPPNCRGRGIVQFHHWLSAVSSGSNVSRSRASVPWTAKVLPVQGSGCLVQSKSHRCRSIPGTGSWTCPRVILLRLRPDEHVRGNGRRARVRIQGSTHSGAMSDERLRARAVAGKFVARFEMRQVSAAWQSWHAYCADYADDCGSMFGAGADQDGDALHFVLISDFSIMRED